MGKLVMSDKFVSAIQEYGKERLCRDTGLSQALISMVCNKKRNFSPATTITLIVPLIWHDRHVMLSDVWELVE